MKERHRLLYNAVALALLMTFSVVYSADPPPSPAPTPTPTPKPTGACTVTVTDITPTCTNGMTQDDCNATANSVGGTADWEQGQSCP